MSAPTSDRIAAAIHAHYAVRSSPWRVFHEVLLGPQGSQRIDTWALCVTWTGWRADAYEIKASRSDFLRDLHSGKWRGYLPHCSHFYFAAPKGVIRLEEVPDGVGLVNLCDGEAMRFVRRAAFREWTPDASMLAATLFTVETGHGCELLRGHGGRNYQAALTRMRSVRELARETDRAAGKIERHKRGKLAGKDVSAAEKYLAEARREKDAADSVVSAALDCACGLGLSLDRYELLRDPAGAARQIRAALEAGVGGRCRKQVSEAHAALGRLLAACGEEATT